MTFPSRTRPGVTTATGSIGDLVDTTLPLKAIVKVSIHEPGGRTTDKTVDIPVRTHDVAIGIRPDFDDGSVPGIQGRAGFEIIALNGDGKRIAASGLTYSWVREDTNYQWFQDNGSWKWRIPSPVTVSITSGNLDIGAEAPAKLAQAFPGRLSSHDHDPKSRAASSGRFDSCWLRTPPATVRPHSRCGRQTFLRGRPDGACLHQTCVTDG